MKKKIILTLIIVVLLIFGNMLLKIGDYGVTQNYAQIATQQVNGDNAYYALKTQSSVMTYMWLIKTVVILISCFCIYLVWKPKKVTE